MKRLERRINIGYNWYRTDGHDIPEHHVGTLEEDAMSRINEMTAQGYVCGELCTSIRLGHDDGDDGIEYRGWWTADDASPSSGTRSTE